MAFCHKVLVFVKYVVRSLFEPCVIRMVSKGQAKGQKTDENLISSDFCAGLGVFTDQYHECYRLNSGNGRIPRGCKKPGEQNQQDEKRDGPGRGPGS